jgi:hypothetical protein
MEKYNIVRFYKKSGKRKIIIYGLTLKQAQSWCSREYTHKEGVWFDGYEKQ